MDNLDVNILTQDVESLAARYTEALHRHVLAELAEATSRESFLPTRVLAWFVFLEAARDAAEDLAVMHFADQLDSL